MRFWKKLCIINQVFTMNEVVESIQHTCHFCDLPLFVKQIDSITKYIE